MIPRLDESGLLDLAERDDDAKASVDRAALVEELVVIRALVKARADETTAGAVARAMRHTTTWGTCVECPIDPGKHQRPDVCMNRDRYDHRIPWERS